MSNDMNPSTAESNGMLWGARSTHWAEIQEGVCEPVYIAVLDRLGIKHGITYFDAGCGAGMAAQLADERGAKVFGIDASSNLLEIARERVPDGEFVIGDLENLPYEDSQFDCVVGFNSFQYAGNPDIALKEAKRVAKPGGSVVVMTWGKPEGMEAASLISALAPLMPPPPPGAPGPFALSDVEALKRFSNNAGLEPVEVLDVDSPWHYPNLQVALDGLMSSGVSMRAIENSSTEAVASAYKEALKPFCQTDNSYVIGAQFWCLISKS